MKLQFELPQGLFAANDTVFAPPCYSVDGEDVCDFVFQSRQGPRSLKNGGTEERVVYASKAQPDLTLTLYFRHFPGNAILRFRYELDSAADRVLTKPEGVDRLTYFSLPRPQGDCTEIRISEFDSIAHTFAPTYVPADETEIAVGTDFMGPIALFEGAARACLFAYEHGSETPDRYLLFRLQKTLSVEAVKGNYWHNKPVKNHKSVWFEYGCAQSRDDLLRSYREFFLKYICENPASRTPYIFYNTWNGQERNNYFNHRPYLETLNLEHTLREIDIAHRLGVEVFVIDTGWYNKTGEWIVDDVRFPDHLKEVKAKLDGYGMKLGLWFNPTVAAKSTALYREHPEYVVNRDGKDSFWGSIWETEESYGMCLCTEYADYFAKRLIELSQTLGVTYFKWDAIGQYDCNAPYHNHGCGDRKEAGECYAYELGIQMQRIVELVSEACPEAIVDFDVTEAGRFVGLGFLSVGKYFLINNGPYFWSFDIPKTVQMEPDTINVFFYPGPARSRVCRKSILFDELIPSVLFLTHFLPDGPRLSQDNAIASMLLGGNGIWGDLLSLTEEEIQVFHDATERYRRVREDVTAAYPRIKGKISGSPEIYEKLNTNGRGMVTFFTRSAGTVRHITAPIPDAEKKLVIGADKVEVRNGCLILTVNLERDGARCVFVE